MAKNVREYCSDTRKLSYFLASLKMGGKFGGKKWRAEMG